MADKVCCVAENVSLTVAIVALHLSTVTFSYSLHAVKDESYIRASLHRQSTRLHHATVAYAVSCLFLLLLIVYGKQINSMTCE